MKREQRIGAIISSFSDGDQDHVAEQVNKFYDPRWQFRVEAAIALAMQGYFDGEQVAAVLASDDIQIRIDTLMRDIAEKVVAREYAIEIDNLDIEGKQGE